MFIDNRLSIIRQHRFVFGRINTRPRSSRRLAGHGIDRGIRRAEEFGARHEEVKACSDYRR
jgi:hypothetical protein